MIGVNCTAPWHIASLLRIARPLTTKGLIVYPNRGEMWHGEQGCFIPNEQSKG